MQKLPTAVDMGLPPLPPEAAASTVTEFVPSHSPGGSARATVYPQTRASLPSMPAGKRAQPHAAGNGLPVDSLQAHPHMTVGRALLLVRRSANERNRAEMRQRAQQAISQMICLYSPKELDQLLAICDADQRRLVLESLLKAR